MFSDKPTALAIPSGVCTIMAMQNDQVLNSVHENSRAFYEGSKSSAEAFCAIDTVAGSVWNYYPGIINETRVLFDSLIESYISEDVDRHRHETYASRMLREIRDAGTQPDEDFFRMKVTGNGETKWFNVTPAQLDALIPIFEV